MPPGRTYTCPHQRCPLPHHRRFPGGQRAQKLRDLLTVCVKVLPDFQELGCRQLGQVQVGGLLLRASHGELLGDLRRAQRCPCARLRSRTRPGPARHAAFIYGAEAAPAPGAGRGRARSENRPGARWGGGGAGLGRERGVGASGAQVGPETPGSRGPPGAEARERLFLPLSDLLEYSHPVLLLAWSSSNSSSNSSSTSSNNNTSLTRS